MSSPGSCLESFRVNPYIECDTDGKCDYYANKYSYWLVTLEGDTSQSYDVTERTLRHNEYEKHISRCSVCILQSAGNKFAY